MNKLIVVISTIMLALVAAPAAFATGGPPERFTICHVAGLANDPANYITLEDLPYPAVFGPGGHFNENGTPAAGHEQDTMGPCNPPSPPVDIEVRASVAFQNATCEAAASYTATPVAGITYALIGTVAPGNTVTVTATADEGYVLVGPSTFEFTFAAAPTDCGTPPPPPPPPTPPTPPERCLPPNPDGTYGGKDGKPGNDECVADPIPTPVVTTPVETPPVVTPLPTYTPTPTPEPTEKPVKEKEEKTKPKSKVATPKPDKPVSTSRETVQPTSGETLPYTGMNAWLTVLVGLALLGTGLGLRRLGN